MRDEIYDREYQSGRAELHAGIDRLVDPTAHVFRRLAAIQFDAPWRKGDERLASPLTSTRQRTLLLVGVVLASGASIATALVPFGTA